MVAFQARTGPKNLGQVKAARFSMSLFLFPAQHAFQMLMIRSAARAFKHL